MAPWPGGDEPRSDDEMRVFLVDLNDFFFLLLILCPRHVAEPCGTISERKFKRKKGEKDRDHRFRPSCLRTSENQNQTVLALAALGH